MLTLIGPWALHQLALPMASRTTATTIKASRWWAYRPLALVAAGVGLISLWLSATALLERTRAPLRWLAPSLAQPLTFGEAGPALQTLQTLRQAPEVQRAWLTRFDGQPLAAYAAQASAQAPDGAQRAASADVSASCPAALAAQGWAWHLDHLLLGQTVRFQGVPVGTLCLQVGLTGLYRQFACTTAAGLLLGGLVSHLVARSHRTGESGLSGGR